MRQTTHLAISSALAALALLIDATSSSAATPPGLTCEKRVARELRTCSNSVSRQQLSCMRRTGATCLATDTRIASALSKAADHVLDDCPDTATITAAGYSAILTPAGLVARVQEACTSTSASLGARSFGGPQAAVRATADKTGKSCLDNAYSQGRSVIDYAFWQKSTCIQSAHGGRSCDPLKISDRIASKVARATTSVARRCASPTLASLVAVDPMTFIARATDQGECLVPTAHANTSPLTVACGPRASIPVPQPATATQVVLDSDAWGTRCGDGSPFAFWVRLAPAGQPLNKVVVFMAGGGSCVDGPDCAATSPDLFESVGDTMPGTGLMSSTAATNPFVNWTKVFIPYCTQDGHTGGGITNAFPEKTVQRYGALNVRAAMRYVRDVLWTSMDASDAEGFRPDRLTVLFSGSSAGGLGAQFNYHYVLDDLRWVHATLLPDSALGLDNGAGAAIARGTLAFMPVTPGWAAEPMAPPYCHDATCGEGWNRFLFAMSPRLKATSEQQVLTITNQLDATQRAVGQFANNAHFINTLRSKYCEQRGTNGLHSFLPDSQPQVHGNINDNSRYNQIVTAGILMRDWIAQAMSDPDGVIDRVGTGLTSINGALPFPCEVGSPSGAFLDAASASHF